MSLLSSTAVTSWLHATWLQLSQNNSIILVPSAHTHDESCYECKTWQLQGRMMNIYQGNSNQNCSSRMKIFSIMSHSEIYENFSNPLILKTADITEWWMLMCGMFPCLGETSSWMVNVEPYTHFSHCVVTLFSTSDILVFILWWRELWTHQLLLIRKCVVQSHCKSTKWSIFHSLRPRPHNSDFCMPQQTSSSQPWEAKLSNVQDPMNAATYSITRSNISYSTHSNCYKVNKATSELLH